MSNMKGLPNTRKLNIDPTKLCDQIKAMEYLREMPPLDDSSNIEELNARIRSFFEFAIENNLKPGIELLAASLGVTRQRLWQWGQKNDKRGQTINRARQMISALLEQWSIDGEINPTTAIWLQKNHFGYKDEVTVSAEVKNALDDLPSRDDILARIPTAIADSQDDDAEIIDVDDYDED